MKRLLLFLFSILFSLPVLPFSYEYEGQTLTYSILSSTDHTCEVSSYQNASGNLKIPATVTNNGEKYSVTSISRAAFDRCKELNAVEIPHSVTYIGEFAFYECTRLISVVIPNSVTSIGHSAFKFSGLTSIEIPNSVTSIGDGTFYDCNDLKEITIANGESTLDFGAYVFNGVNITKLYLGRNYTYSEDDYQSPPFSNKTSLIELTIGSTVTTIGKEAFKNCCSLKEVTIDDGECALDFGSSVFYGAKLTKLYLGRNITCSDTNTSKPFSSQSSLTVLTIGNSVTSIGARDFSMCKGLTSVEIPNSVTSIEHQAFDGCNRLTSLRIGNSVASIGEAAFERCTGLTSVEIPNSVTTIGSRAFSNCI